jgi:hypothetical protein
LRGRADHALVGFDVAPEEGAGRRGDDAVAPVFCFEGREG